MTIHTHHPKRMWPISPTGLVRWLKIALAALAVIVLAHAVSLWLQIGLLSGAQSGGRITHEAALTNDRR
jgi:hypothetical protein